MLRFILEHFAMCFAIRITSTILQVGEDKRHEEAEDLLEEAERIR
jgi:hypothetical protein